jgi:DNA-binding LacI/PurR family transcriptional regulator
MRWKDAGSFAISSCIFVVGILRDRSGWAKLTTDTTPMPSKRIQRKPVPITIRASQPLVVSMPSRVSLVDQTVQALRQLIANQRWQDFLPSEEVLRAQFGISRVTLRKALSELVEQRWIKLGGRGQRHRITPGAHPAAAILAAGGGVKCLSQFTEFALTWSTRIIFDEIRQSLLARECQLEFYQRVSLWRGNPKRHLDQITGEPGVAGWILYRASPLIQKWFQESRIPCIVLGPCHEEVSLPSVAVDYAALGRHAAAEASRLGHHHIAFLDSDPGVASALTTLEGLRKISPKDGRKGKITVIGDDDTVAGLRKSLVRVMGASDPPTLIMVTEAVQAMPVMGILREMNLEIPKDVSMIVRDHEPFLNRSVPEFTRYTFDWLRFGRTAAGILTMMIQGGVRKSTHRTLLPVFIAGQTLARRRAD